MDYKLFFIYENYKTFDLRIKVEVSHNNNSKSTIPPFIRNISTKDLLNKTSNIDKEAAMFLNQLGQNYSPFYISNNLLTLSEIQRLLKTVSNSYYKTNRFGSLKKIKDVSKYLPSTQEHVFRNGKLNGGELYITNPINWQNNVQVRFLYENAITSFFPIYSKLPFLTTGNYLLNRDLEAEIKLLSPLNMLFSFNKDQMSINIENYDFEQLKELYANKWKLYIQKEKSSKQSLFLKQNNYGITWFSTKEADTKSDHIIDLILQAYLENRNYRETQGVTLLFNKNEIVKDSTKTFPELFTDDDNLKSIFKNIDYPEEDCNELKIKLTNKFVGSLRNYQLKGLAWLRKQRNINAGCLLADEMGLGKTIQIIAYLVTIEKQVNPHIIIAPTSLLPNWHHELDRFAPNFKNSIDIQPKHFDGSKKIILISYDTLRQRAELFLNKTFDTIIVDEAQIIKNRNTQNYKSISLLKSKHRIILTGTPIENSINDIWSHFLFLIPELKQILLKLKNRNIQTENAQFIKFSSKLFQPFILRRIKSEVARDLPDLVEKNVYIDLSLEEQFLYKNIQSVFAQALKSGLSGRVNSIALEALLRLRQACILPKMLPKTLTGSTKIRSSKIHIALQYINEFLKEDKKVLVFSQFIEVINELERQLGLMSIKSVRLDGSTIQRDIPIQQFQQQKEITVFLISLRAGGFGLNLTSAERVILLDSWWNPAVEKQAFARAHRIGQKKNVIAFRLICRNTVEEKMLELHEKKNEIVDIFNEDKVRLSINELKELILYKNDN